MAKILSAPTTKKTVSLKLPRDMLNDIDRVINLSPKKSPRNIWVSDALTRLESNESHQELIQESWFESGDNAQTKLLLTVDATKALEKMLKNEEKSNSISSVIRTAIIQKLIISDLSHDENPI